jgi:hypothetical protein
MGKNTIAIRITVNGERKELDITGYPGRDDGP